MIGAIVSRRTFRWASCGSLGGCGERLGEWGDRQRERRDRGRERERAGAILGEVRIERGVCLRTCSCPPEQFEIDRIDSPSAAICRKVHRILHVFPSLIRHRTGCRHRDKSRPKSSNPLILATQSAYLQPPGILNLSGDQVESHRVDTSMKQGNPVCGLNSGTVQAMADPFGRILETLQLPRWRNPADHRFPFTDRQLKQPAEAHCQLDLG